MFLILLCLQSNQTRYY